MLTIPREQLAFIVDRARAFDAETAIVDPDSGSNPTDDNAVAALQDAADNPARQELATALDALDDEQRVEILALVWLGRGDFGADEWHAALDQARDIHNPMETEYLLGTPLLADYLEEAVSALGYSLRD